VTQELTATHKFNVLLLASATSALIMLDTNIVAVSLPAIARDLHAGFAGITWIVSAYLLTFAALLLPSGSLADLHGRRRVLMIGVLLFLLASAACGLAPSVLVLEISRAVQGIGGSLLLTAALAIIGATFAPAERAKAYAFWGTSLGIAITSGPIVGGVITGTFGWRWAFLINVPVCLVLLAFMRGTLPESRDPSARHFDAAGVVTLAVGLFALIWALIDGNAAGWTSPAILTRLGAAAASLAAFGAVEALQMRPMLDLGLFRNRALLGAICAGFGYGASAQVMIFFLPIYLQGAFGLGPMAAGFAMLPFAAPLFLAPRLAAALLSGWPQRSILILALAITAAGNLLLAVLAQSGSYAAAAAAMIVAGIGTGILNPETARVVQAQLPVERAGMASGLGGTVRFVSLLLGVAALGAVVAHFKPAIAAGRDAGAAPGFGAAALLAAGIALLALTGVAILMANRRPAGGATSPLPTQPIRIANRN